MNQFAWTRQDLSLKTADLMRDGEALGVMSSRRRKQRAKRFLGMAFADLVPVAANIVYTGQVLPNQISGEALTQGQAVFQDTANNFGGGTSAWWRSNATTTNKDKATGIALTSCAGAGQSVNIGNDSQTGTINLGCSVAAASIYIVSSNLGGFVLYIDATTPTTSWKTCIALLGISTTVCKLVFVPSGVAHL